MSPPRPAWGMRMEKGPDFFRRAAAFALKLPIHAYRYSLSMLIGRRCRHLPTCSEYALDAIDRNGPWRGFWLALSRFSRCRPGGTSGFDPAPDIRGEHHGLAPWRYGRWRAADIAGQQG
jgi:putative membrane protein insertion efficiency factor